MFYFSYSFVFLPICLLHNVRALSKEQAVVQCLSEYNVDNATHDYFKTVGELPEGTDERVKCVFLCIPKKLGWADDKGFIDKDKIINAILAKHPQLPRDAFTSVVNKCADERSETDFCDKWYQFSKCQMKAYLKMKSELPN